MTGAGERERLAGAEALVDRYLALLEELVVRESPSGDEDRNRVLSAFLVDELERRGARVGREPAPGLGEHLVSHIGGEDPRERPLLVMGHMDTVHPAGTLERYPFRVEERVVRGPGVYDMKGGLAAVLLGLDLLEERGERPRGDVIFLITCDEEIGSHTSRRLIEELARGARAALVIEPCVPGGMVKASRKGVAVYSVALGGRPAHAGIEPGAGASAVHELARLVLRLLSLEDAEAGTTVNVGVIAGGTRSNVVAGEAQAEVDVRFWTREEAERVDRAVRELTPDDARCSLKVEGGINRWALERTPESAQLIAAAQGEAQALGYELGVGRTGGASDGNLASAVGCPTLDGLGPDGGGAHSLDEHILLPDIPHRIALLAGLFRRL